MRNDLLLEADEERSDCAIDVEIVLRGRSLFKKNRAGGDDNILLSHFRRLWHCRFVRRSFSGSWEFYSRGPTVLEPHDYGVGEEGGCAFSLHRFERCGTALVDVQVVRDVCGDHCLFNPGATYYSTDLFVCVSTRCHGRGRQRLSATSCCQIF